MQPSFALTRADRSAPSVRETIPVPAPTRAISIAQHCWVPCIPSSMIRRASDESRASRACVILADSPVPWGEDASSTSQELSPTPLSHTFYPVAYTMSKPRGRVCAGTYLVQIERRLLPNREEAISLGLQRNAVHSLNLLLLLHVSGTCARAEENGHGHDGERLLSNLARCEIHDVRSSMLPSGEDEPIGLSVARARRQGY